MKIAVANVQEVRDDVLWRYRTSPCIWECKVKNWKIYTGNYEEVRLVSNNPYRNANRLYCEIDLV